MAAVVGAALTLLLVYVLDVPMLGETWGLVSVLALLTFASLGVGFVVALVSSSEQQAAQITMLVLLASIFFSGLLFSLDRVLWPAQAISLVLPATYGIGSVQNSMLRGEAVGTLDLVALGSMTLAFFAAAIALLKREWRPA
jgi:ABC-2 type transport system permease protein